MSALKKKRKKEQISFFEEDKKNSKIIKVYEKKFSVSTFICPSIPVAAATIPMPPLGSLAKSFVAYALRIL